jgi:serine/threonine-protein kinase
MTKRLVVTDGPDRGRSFSLPTSGAVRIGSNHQRADIFLHDKLVQEVHCLLEVDGNRIVVRNSADSPTIFVNSLPTSERVLRLGDVLRVGNSQLRLEGPATGTAGHAGPGDLALAARAATGLSRLTAELTNRTLAHYEIGPVLGHSTRSVVFRARDVKSWRTVALKVLPPEFPRNDAEMQRFVQTMKGLLALRHPHLVTLFKAGRTGLYCWLAFEYVEGESLAQVLTRGGTGGKPVWRYALRLGIHIGRALAFIHQRRLVHGNLTPQNILLGASDKPIKLADLMLGQALAGSALDVATLEAKRLAELPYLPPEAANSHTAVDQLSDIYALGAVIYARLTDRPPFQGASPEETRALIAEGGLVKPRQRHLPSAQASEEKHWLLSETLNWAQQQQSSIPRAFEAAVARMLARRPEDRYPTAAELVSDLERIAAQEKVKV